MRVEEVIEVARPLEEAFEYVADFSNAASWDPGIAESTKVSDGPVGLGTVFDVVALFRGSRVPFRYEVTAHEPGRRIVLEGDGRRARSTDEIVFESLGDRTRITYRADLRMKGLFRAVEPLLGETFRELGRKALAGLAEALDGAAHG